MPNDAKRVEKDELTKVLTAHVSGKVELEVGLYPRNTSTQHLAIVQRTSQLLLRYKLTDGDVMDVFKILTDHPSWEWEPLSLKLTAEKYLEYGTPITLIVTAQKGIFTVHDLRT